MSNVNRIVLIGNITDEIDSLIAGDGSPMAKFSVTVERPPRLDGTSESDLIPIVTWRETADFASKHGKKGRLVLIDGRIQERSYLAGDGQKKWVTEVVGRNISFLDRNVSEPNVPKDNPIIDKGLANRDINDISLSKQVYDDFPEPAMIEDDIPF